MTVAGLMKILLTRMGFPWIYIPVERPGKFTPLPENREGREVESQKMTG